MSNKKVEFIRKHKPLTKKEIEDQMQRSAEAKKEITTNALELEANLIKFNQICDPLIDPESGLALCWVRRPTQTEWEAMLPPELLEYRNQEDIPVEITKKYTDMQFEMMANLIDNPKHDKIWWKAHSNLVLQQLFQVHLSSVLEELGITAENF